MDQPDTSRGPDSDVDTPPTATARGRDSVSRAASYLRQGANSGAVTAVVGGAGLFGGLRALLRGRGRRRALGGLAVGAAFLAAAFAQRRSRGGDPSAEVPEGVDTGPDLGGADARSGVEESDPTDSGPDVAEPEPADDGAGAVDEEDAAGRAAAEAADASPDQTLDGTTAEAGEGADADALTEGEDAEDSEGTDVDIDRLGESALDAQSREVPAPQRAFDRGFLAHSAEAFWGIRTDDDAVLVSQDYDAVEDRDGVQYVASTQIGEDVRELPVPDAVLNHWNEVLGGGTAVAGGDDLLFVTTDDLAADGVLRVLPAAWADDLPE